MMRERESLPLYLKEKSMGHSLCLHVMFYALCIVLDAAGFYYVWSPSPMRHWICNGEWNGGCRVGSGECV